MDGVHGPAKLKELAPAQLRRTRHTIRWHCKVLQVQHINEVSLSPESNWDPVAAHNCLGLVWHTELRQGNRKPGLVAVPGCRNLLSSALCSAWLLAKILIRTRDLES